MCDECSPRRVGRGSPIITILSRAETHHIPTCLDGLPHTCEIEKLTAKRIN